MTGARVELESLMETNCFLKHYTVHGFWQRVHSWVHFVVQLCISVDYWTDVGDVMSRYFSSYNAVEKDFENISG